MLQVEVIRALGMAVIDRVMLTLPQGSTVADALRQSMLDGPRLAGYAIYGERVTPDTPLHDGDRLELLRSLTIDPQQARRRRAVVQGRAGK